MDFLSPALYTPLRPGEVNWNLGFKMYLQSNPERCAQFCMRIERWVRKTLSLWFHNLLRQETEIIQKSFRGDDRFGK